MKSLIILLALFASGLNAADLSIQLQQCRALSNELQRLACYDKIALGSEDRAPAPSLNTAAVIEQPLLAAAPQPAADFGLEQKKVQQQTEAVDQLSLELKSVKTNSLGLLVFTFTNGQVWRQTSKDFFTVKEGSAYQVDRGMFGAFYMNKVGTNRKIRVVREQ